MKAEIATETKRFIVCPGCGHDEEFRIDHLDDDEAGCPFGPWTCRKCGTAIRGRTAPPGADIEIVPAERAMALVLVEVGRSTPPVFAVLQQPVFKPDRPGSWTGDLKSLINDHCPSNFLECAAFLGGGEVEPRGVLRFIQAVPRPDGFEHFGSWAEWAAVFDQLPVRRNHLSIVGPLSFTASAQRRGR